MFPFATKPHKFAQWRLRFKNTGGEQMDTSKCPGLSICDHKPQWGFWKCRESFTNSLWIFPGFLSLRKGAPTCTWGTASTLVETAVLVLPQLWWPMGTSEPRFVKGSCILSAWPRLGGSLNQVPLPRGKVSCQQQCLWPHSALIPLHISPSHHLHKYYSKVIHEKLSPHSSLISAPDSPQQGRIKEPGPSDLMWPLQFTACMPALP